MSKSQNYTPYCRTRPVSAKHHLVSNEVISILHRLLFLCRKLDDLVLDALAFRLDHFFNVTVVIVRIQFIDCFTIAAYRALERSLRLLVEGRVVWFRFSNCLLPLSRLKLFLASD